MQRTIMEALQHWKAQTNRLPLLLRGARQIGKTYIVEQFAKSHFQHFVNINFELEPEFESCFHSLKAKDVVMQLQLKQNVPIIPSQTLLFLDEIQNCPNAIASLRYFKEQMPELHVIGAGSLLEFVLNDAAFHMPVGRVQYLYMHPLSFDEFLMAKNKPFLWEHIQQSDLVHKPSEVAHQELLKLVREYCAIGGMPAVVNQYLADNTFLEAQHLQTSLLSTYRDDFGKYASRAQHKYLQVTFDRAPYLVGQQLKYSHIDAEFLSRDIKHAIAMLEQAGILYRVYVSACSGLPLNTLLNEKKFKLLFVDVGLTSRVGKVPIETLLQEDLLFVNQGKLAEHFVGQELLAYQDPYETPSLYFWARDKLNSQAEVDYVMQVQGKIVPIEVKSGKTARLKSLKRFMDEKHVSIGVQVSQQPLAFEDGILKVPVYMLKQLKRLYIEVDGH